MNANITEPAILINLSRSFKPGMSDADLYEKTRKDWVIAPGKHSPPPIYAFAVYKGVIEQVYKIDAWHPSVTLPGRRAFTGSVALDKAHYLKQTVAHVKPGTSNPIKYVNC